MQENIWLGSRHILARSLEAELYFRHTRTDLNRPRQAYRQALCSVGGEDEKPQIYSPFFVSKCMIFGSVPRFFAVVFFIWLHPSLRSACVSRLSVLYNIVYIVYPVRQTEEMLRERDKEDAMHCKGKMPKIWNKYSQKKNIGASVPISTFMCLWANYIFPRLVYLFCWRKYVDPSWEYINRSQAHESGNWGWGGAIPIKGIYKRNCRCSVVADRERWGGGQITRSKKGWASSIISVSLQCFTVELS